MYAPPFLQRHAGFLVADVLLSFIAYREVAQPRLPHARTFLPDSGQPDRRSGSVQDLLGLLDEARPRTLRGDAAAPNYRH